MLRPRDERSGQHSPARIADRSRTLFELGLVVVLAAAAPLVGQALLGQQLISAIVSVAVGIILFESGLGLKLRELTGAASRVSRRLVTVGILVTWAVGPVAAYLLFDLSFEVALVLGAVLVVSGPTVVGPLLDFIRRSKPVDLVLRWEGTLADPIGATLGVVVFNAVLAGHAKAGQEIFQFLLNVGVGIGLGIPADPRLAARARFRRDVRQHSGRARRGAVLADHPDRPHDPDRDAPTRARRDRGPDRLSRRLGLGPARRAGTKGTQGRRVVLEWRGTILSRAL